MVRKGRKENSGQLHTLEGFTAAFLILFAILFAFQSVSITPTSSSTASQQVETNNYVLADDVLAAASADGSLKEAVLNWSDSNGSFRGATGPRGEYQGRNPPGEFGEILDEAFFSQGLAYNIRVYCDGNTDGEQFVIRGTPSRHAITATETVVLYDNDTLTDTSTELWETDSHRYDSNVCPQASSDSSLYNVVEVRITVWRM